jgi:hypothetical protein
MAISLIEQYYEALLDDSITANKLLVKILEVEENLKIKPRTEENDNEN